MVALSNTLLEKAESNRANYWKR